LAELVRFDDVWVRDARREPRLVQKGCALVAAGAVRGKPLDRDDAIEAVRADEPADVDDPHPTPRELEEYVVAPETRRHEPFETVSRKNENRVLIRACLRERARLFSPRHPKLRG